MKYDNYTVYGIHDKVERLLMTSYGSTIFLSSLIGDILILIGSLKYDAIKLHNLMVVFIQYIAVCDMLIAIFRVFPETVALAMNKELFGEFFCRIGYCVGLVGICVYYLLVSALSLTKLLIVKYPLRAISFPTKIAHLTALVLSISTVAFTMVRPLLNVDDIYFCYLTYGCQFDRYASEASDERWVVKISSIAAGLAGFIATLIVAVSSAVLLVIAKRITERGPDRLQWQGIIMVLLTAAVFVISALPGAVWFFGSYFVKEDSFWNSYFFRFVYFFSSLNVLSNFYIYILTLTSFREFLKSRIKLIAAPFIRCCSPNEEDIAGRAERQRLLSDK